MPNRPMEFWKVVVYEADGSKTERIYRGQGGRKKAFECASMARRKKETLVRTEVFCCKPVWDLAECWEAQEL